MTYELAKKLKDAGFPQTLKYCPIWENLYYLNGEIVQGAFKESKLKDGMVKVPTLSELIEACGDKLESLNQIEEGKWEAWSTILGTMGDEGKEITYGFTTEEAVANLWLALNKNAQRT